MAPSTFQLYWTWCLKSIQLGRVQAVFRGWENKEEKWRKPCTTQGILIISVSEKCNGLNSSLLRDSFLSVLQMKWQRRRCQPPVEISFSSISSLTGMSETNSTMKDETSLNSCSIPYDVPVIPFLKNPYSYRWQLCVVISNRIALSKHEEK